MIIVIKYILYIDWRWLGCALAINRYASNMCPIVIRDILLVLLCFIFWFALRNRTSYKVPEVRKPDASTAHKRPGWRFEPKGVGKVSRWTTRRGRSPRPGYRTGTCIILTFPKTFDNEIDNADGHVCSFGGPTLSHDVLTVLRRVVGILRATVRCYLLWPRWVTCRVI